ncbi:hypothetical protein D3C72_2316570 [compost metagenome]
MAADVEQLGLATGLDIFNLYLYSPARGINERGADGNMPLFIAKTFKYTDDRTGFTDSQRFFGLHDFIFYEVSALGTIRLTINVGARQCNQ